MISQFKSTNIPPSNALLCLSTRGHPSTRERAHSGHGVSAAHPSLLVLRYGSRRRCSGTGLRRTGLGAPLPPIPLCGQEERPSNHLQILTLHQRCTTGSGAYFNYKTRARWSRPELAMLSARRMLDLDLTDSRTVGSICTFFLQTLMPQWYFILKTLRNEPIDISPLVDCL